MLARSLLAVALTAISLLHFTPHATADVWVRRLEQFQSLPIPAPGQESPQPRLTVLIDGTTYHYGDLVADFLHVATSDTLWFETARAAAPDGFARMIDWARARKWDLADPEVAKRYAYLQEHMPWFADYIYRPQGLPTHGVIHKWTSPVAIGIGWPMPEGAEWQDQVAVAAFTERFAAHIAAVATQLSEITGLSITFHPEEAAASHLSRLLIIPDRHWPSRTWLSNAGYRNQIHDFEEGLIGAVPFASNDRRLDGFILPEVDNSIGLSVCKLETTLDDQSLRSLLTTCLVRSLGLTGTSRLHASVLGGAPGPAVATYDESMLQMLYCKALSVGSDKNRALRLLIEPNDCFRHSDGFTLHISNP